VPLARLLGLDKELRSGGFAFDRAGSEYDVSAPMRLPVFPDKRLNL